MKIKPRSNPYLIVEGVGIREGSYNKYPEFQVWEDGRQAGIKEVIEWINKHIANPFPYAKEEWESKLKEWGLK